MKNMPAQKKKDWFKISFFSTLVLLSISFLILAGLQITKNLNPTSPNPTAIQPNVAPSKNFDSTENWKTYTDEKLNFEIRYPSNYFIKNNIINNVISTTISNDSSFEKNEFALLITIKSLDESDNFQPLKTDNTQLLNFVGYSDLSSIWGEKVTGNFVGNPPWGYYQFVFQYAKTNSAILVTTRIHGIDEISKEDEGSEGAYSQIAKKILSTFKFIDTNSSNSSLDKLTSKKWVWVKTQLNDDTTKTPKKIGDFSINFEKDGKLSIDTDCNNMSTTYSLGSENTIQISDKIMSTKMYCAESLENIFSKDLVEIAMFSINDSKQLILDLKYDTGNMIFE
ncbi:META domain-containing protein [Patescibacteria group bacterium]|nr:META domain-containing protein [Patescibacteria group bacterium]